MHVTDDWLGAAPLLGLTPKHVERVLRENLELADAITAVSPGLAAKLESFCGRQVSVLPNGCSTPEPPHPRETTPVAALAGQLNERLDSRILEALGESGLPVVVLGPCTGKDTASRRALDRFLSRPTVQWRGAVSPDEVARLLSTAAVGLTPYATSEFNIASFPLKTLEYLSFGLPVVATDLPAARWLSNPYVSVTRSATEFVDRVRNALQWPPDHRQRLRIRATTRSHTWSVRAEQMLTLMEGRQTTEPGNSGGPRHVGSR
jgi:teichuronic acid biosynthesis glycosyltransferase TuaH